MKNDWLILMILGGSATGKTVAADKLAKQLGTDCIHLDDFRLELQKKPDKASPSFIRLLLDEQIYQKTDQELIKIHQKISNHICKMSFKRIKTYLKLKKRVIVEGDDLTPKFVNDLLKKDKKIKAVCVYEKNLERIRDAIKYRDKQKVLPAENIFQNQLRHAYYNGLFILQQARKLSIPCIQSRPFHTLPKRIMRSID
ncbi:hypothetical protein HY612_05110 [Candidatus Roizmanbacteria bacterium]|nr:hypothetical protein [Candidatus Roizmanbacteria bacterium]